MLIDLDINPEGVTSSLSWDLNFFDTLLCRGEGSARFLSLPSSNVKAALSNGALSPLSQLLGNLSAMFKLSKNIYILGIHVLYNFTKSKVFD